jgi:hypothetical protein
MIESLDDSPDGVTAFRATGTVLKRDVKEALDKVGMVEKLLVVVTADFDGYMSELVAGLERACSNEDAGRCALVVPAGMAREAKLRGESDSFSIFEARDPAVQWLSA